MCMRERHIDFVYFVCSLLFIVIYMPLTQELGIVVHYN